MEGTLVPKAVSRAFQDSPWERKEKNVPTASNILLARVLPHSGH